MIYERFSLCIQFIDKIEWVVKVCCLSRAAYLSWVVTCEAMSV